MSAIFAIGYRNELAFFLILVAFLYVLFSLTYAMVLAIPLWKRVQQNNIPEHLLASDSTIWQRSKYIAENVSAWDIKI